MFTPTVPPYRRGQAGGITILVTMMLLVLLTISAFAMSKNSLREVIISGTTRQAADVRNMADSGLEWSMYWMADDLTGARPAPGAGTAAEALRNLTFATAFDPTMTGKPQTLPVTSEMTLSSSADLTRSYQLSLTTMGEIELLGTKTDATKTLDTYNPATLQLWSVRSDAQSAYASGQTFLHSREAWFTLLPKPKPQ